MKKLINDPDHVVRESLEGFAAAHPDLVSVHFNPTFVVRSDGVPDGRVGILSGGGSGHEPMHNGFVGRGMLDAACPGEVFTSPTPDQMLAATEAVSAGAGVLHLVKNYTGDVMNFEMAEEMGADEGIEVRSVVIDDDVAVEDSTYTAGRRGVGGTVLIEKMCGAAADDGRSLEEITDLARRCNSEVRSMGMALTSCTVPSAGEPTFQLADDEMEIGIGIHGEPGRDRMSLESADAVVERLMGPILSDLPFHSGDDVLLFVNGMGATPMMELYLCYRKAAAMAEDHGLNVVRNLVGPYITSLEMAGLSITMMRMTDDLVALWDAPVQTPGLRWGQ
ncbi:dihydroxyacetone kinase subunit DhaK [Longibacter salinarum]|uniref:phosphoenolpyruvate--glycerone phosphotransferase n=1 Tax=Longibacter salinarum TaxID=1850348 RepID=A0A2A8D245_9BACT|nr:dihydroxyacetone kinase subunit DhaK [Longibacter salinarum]PEN15029.1 dihydroxyacetone kinase subunit DhaK [Longibacter salinarum]